MATIQTVDAALARYYKWLNKEYDHLFQTYCDDNSIDEDMIATELNTEPLESLLVDFDEDFPFQHPLENEEEGKVFIHNLIKKIWQYPALIASIES